MENPNSASERYKRMRTEVLTSNLPAGAPDSILEPTHSQNLNLQAQMRERREAIETENEVISTEGEIQSPARQTRPHLQNRTFISGDTIPPEAHLEAMQSEFNNLLMDSFVLGVKNIGAVAKDLYTFINPADTIYNSQIREEMKNLQELYLDLDDEDDEGKQAIYSRLLGLEDEMITNLGDHLKKLGWEIGIEGPLYMVVGGVTHVWDVMKLAAKTKEYMDEGTSQEDLHKHRDAFIENLGETLLHTMIVLQGLRMGSTVANRSGIFKSKQQKMKETYDKMSSEVYKEMQTATEILSKETPFRSVEIVAKENISGQGQSVFTSGQQKGMGMKKTTTSVKSKLKETLNLAYDLLKKDTTEQMIRTSAMYDIIFSKGTKMNYKEAANIGIDTMGIIKKAKKDIIMNFELLPSI